VKQKITEVFFLSEDDLGDFSYNTYNLGGLRFFLKNHQIIWVDRAYIFIYKKKRN